MTDSNQCPASDNPTEASADAGLHVRWSCRSVALGLVGLIVVYLILLFFGAIPQPSVNHAPSTYAPEIPNQNTPSEIRNPQSTIENLSPPMWAVAPFVALLLGIAVLPLIPAAQHWWHSNKNKFLLATILGLATLGYYYFLHPGGLDNHFTHQHATSSGGSTVGAVLCNSLLAEYVPFITLLFSLYVISGGINLRGDLRARPSTNCMFLGAGTILASFIGTTGAAMVLIRPLLSTNAERKLKTHTVIFFIFMVCNCGGLLLPIGDPPLFLGYLKGVPFLWTLKLFPYWMTLNGVLLLIYFIWDTWAYRHESPTDIRRDIAAVEPLRLVGSFNVTLLLGVILCVGLVVPGQPFPGTSFVTPVYLREAIMLGLVACSLLCVSVEGRIRNQFDYSAIIEVAALFFGIFIAMQVPIEILNLQGPRMGLDSPVKYFWASGLLSSFLDNAPTYVVFFEAANSLTHSPGSGILQLLSQHYIREDLLAAVSLGAVFMGANTYIGNGPNFMVKSIAETSGVKMPSFFGYMLYSIAILIPLFVVISFVL